MSIPTHRLLFEKISHYDRAQEPVTFGIPFPRGALARAEQFALYDGRAEVYCQKSVTGNWDDGSIRWLLVYCLLDLPGGSAKSFRFAIEDDARDQPAPPAVLTVADGEREVFLYTGPLQLAVGKPGADLIGSVTLHGERLWDEVSWPGFSVTDEQGTAFSTAGDDTAQIEIEEQGPLRAALRISGTRRHRADGFLDYVIRIHAWAGKPYVAMQYQFINREERAQVAVREIHLQGRLSAAGGAVSLTSGQGVYRTLKVVSECEVEIGVDAAKMLRDPSEHHDESFFGDFWVDWNGPRGGVTLTIRQAPQNFPKRLRATPDALEAFLYPRGEHDLVLHQGMAKTHELLFHFHVRDLDVDEISRRSLQFQLPDQPALKSDWYRDAGVWEDVFSGARYGRLEALICNVIDTRPIGLGILSFGDEGTYGYTWQGRGDGKTVWLNGEYDIPHLMFLQYARTGVRRFLEIGRATAQHWVDVDFCHHSPDPLQRGGLMMHSADHVTAGVTVSHQWVERFFDYYHLSGDRDYILKGMRTLESILINMNFQLVVSPGGKKTVVNGAIFKEPLPIPPGGQNYGITIGPLIHFLVAADELDLLRPFDFVY